MRTLKKVFLTGVLGVSVVLAVGTANAEEGKGDPAERQAKMLEKYPAADADKDGTLTREEWRQFRQSQPQAGPPKDRDRRRGGTGEGKPGDFPPARGMGMGGWQPDPEMILKKHPELDTNQDGKLSPEEMQAGREKFLRGMRDRGGPMPMIDVLVQRFDEADADGNGQLSREELMQFKKNVLDRMGPLGPGGPGGQGPAGFGDRGPGGGPPGARLLEKFPEADTDKDGRMSPEEFKAFREKNPDALRQMMLEQRPEMDTDKDGRLSDEELKAARENMRGQGPRHHQGHGGRRGQPKAE
ncbi:MAG TPA: EF-hand domain-containing protein [Phycisphaerae bacterium]|nr:EF-hand domain-containing protein [Phycisphaerae bacterium]